MTPKQAAEAYAEKELRDYKDTTNYSELLGRGR